MRPLDETGLCDNHMTFGFKNLVICILYDVAEPDVAKEH